MKKVFFYSFFLLILLAGLSAQQDASAATMNDYCITPPFVVGGVKPNLLMLIDNSSSMFDLQYVDQGKYTGTCSVTTTQTCSDSVSCPSGETCNNRNFTRNPYYCYDQTFKSSENYTGYFPNKACSVSGRACTSVSDCSGGETCVGPLFYQYNFTDDFFDQVAALPSTCPGGTAYSLSGSLFACISGTTVNTFAASGNYLNWLSASKFDVEKGILTGGKYVGKVCAGDLDTACNVDADCDALIQPCITDPRNIKFLQSESRGCVGRSFIKEALRADFVNYSSTQADPNTSLGVTFGIKGPKDLHNATALSRGGQTYVDIFLGDYVQGKCQTAIDLLADPNSQKQDIITAIDQCLNNAATNKKTCQYDQTTTCNSDTDCMIASGTCTLSPGTCASAGGVCSTNVAGTCTANNGACQGQGNNKKCVGGGKAGASCKNNNDCLFSSCTAGKVGSTCSVNADCTTLWCTNGTAATNPKYHTACLVNADCNVGACTAPASKVGTVCTSNTDCSANACTAGSPANPGGYCASSWDCSSTKGHCLAPASTQVKSTFTQSMHSCYQYLRKGQDIGSNEINQVSNPSGCNQIYAQYKTCTGGAHNGAVCTADADCGGGLCKGGPSSIQPGSPVLLCSSSYAGYCASNPNNDNWQTTSWVPREYGSADACITAKYREYCNAVDIPPVVDPTDSPSQTDQYANLPAILSDMGLEGQLISPIATLTVQRKLAAAPTGLLQDFGDLIRFGAMTFNYNGSPSECPAFMPCPKKCSTTTSLSCSITLDCPAGETCIATTSTVDNLDGGRVTSFIGDPGYCSVSQATPCTKDSDCPASEKCASVGNHSYGLVNIVDSFKAASWTPFGEAFYNAIGYFARSNPYTESPGKSRIALRLNAADFPEGKNPSQYECQANNVLLVTDGMSTADRHPSVTTTAGAYPAPGTLTGCTPYGGSTNLEKLSWIAKNRNIKTFDPLSASPPPTALKKSEYIKTFVVFSGASNGGSGDCNSETLMANTATFGGTTLKRAEKPGELYTKLRESFLEIAAGASSGTAASVLASGEGSGANLIQALFYPSRIFGSTQINWIGSLQNFWYYVDPGLGNSSIREEGNDGAAPYTLDLSGDSILLFSFNGTNTLANLYADKGGGVAGDLLAVKCLDETLTGDACCKGYPMCSSEPIKYLWEAGKKLHQRTADSRKIYTTRTSAKDSEFDLPTTVSDAALISLMDASNADEATAIARYVRGTDVKVCDNVLQNGSKKICTVNADCIVAGESCQAYRSRTVTFNGVSAPWKLGDIINSTPKIASSSPLNLYHKTYLDVSYKNFIGTDAYARRGMVFVGGNDGMLHAFNLGTLTVINDSSDNKAKLDVPYGGTTADLGKEAWAYIPKNALPYLKYLADPNYSHLYYVDQTPYVFDASIGGDPDVKKDDSVPANSWKTVLIGGMRFGGATKDACTADVNGDGVIDGKDCVRTPQAGLGFSSYFALDVTDPTSPHLMWEFSDPGLGFASSGPAVVKINGATAGVPDPKTNGNWYVVFASGPTGPIDTTTHQFKGYSDQVMKLFVLDLKTGTLLRTISTGLRNAFSGSMINAAMDFDQNDPTSPGFYSDDAVYFGYTQAEQDPITVSTRWTKGGVLRLVTKEKADVSQWALSTVIDSSVDSNLGPVSAAVTKLQNFDKHNAFLYFGTGRYYYKIADQVDDPGDTGIRRRLYGVLEPCYKNNLITGVFGFDSSCTDKAGSLGDVSDSSANVGSGGWFINLDLCTDATGAEVACTNTTGFKAERMVTDPLATGIGVVFFTTTKPSADVCEFGGRTHFWAVNYDTGGSVKKGRLKGKALIQVSTGSIEQMDLATAFKQKKDTGAVPDATVDYRRTEMIPGVPPSGSPPGILIPPKPVNRIMHMKER